jgi:hypothetical protein
MVFKAYAALNLSGTRISKGRLITALLFYCPHPILRQISGISNPKIREHQTENQTFPD